jgi:hypothetical protein
MRNLLINLILLIGILHPCCKNETLRENYTAYLPLKVGNYWKINEKNYINVIGKKKIEGKEFYIVFARIGGDVRNTTYYRIDENLDLIQAEFRKLTPTVVFLTKAKFNAQKGDVFYTSSMGDPANRLVEVIEKTEDRIKFKYSLLNGDSLIYYEEYKKGIGFVNNYKDIYINGSSYKF